MPKNERKQVFKRARKLGVRTFHFYRGMEKIFAAADLVVCMGGYNTLCETFIDHPQGKSPQGATHPRKGIPRPSSG
jgi:predicted glycosyltransferase